MCLVYVCQRVICCVLGENCVVSVDVVFFFFKQKTEFEMRISDWSSDVCSSDLPSRHLAFTSNEQVTYMASETDSPDILLRCALDLFGRHGFDGTSTRAIAAAAGKPMSAITYHFGGKEELYVAASRYLSARIAEQKIGRASCRERVCKKV